MLLPQTTGEVVKSDLDWFLRRDGSMFPVSYVSVPLEMPDGRGAVVAFTDIENRLHAEELRSEHEAILAAREASLRRIAALVAGGAASVEVFAAIAREVAGVLGVSLVAVWRYESDGTGTVVGAWSEPPHLLEVGSRWPLDDTVIIARVRETGRPARSDDLADVDGTVADIVQKARIRSAAGAPIVVDGDVWGVMAAGGTEGERLPDHIEDRLAGFTELVATTISNSASRQELARLADEQAALRRVATLVARGVPPPDVFAAVAHEVGVLIGVDVTHMARYELDGTATGVAAWSPAGDHNPVGTRVNTEGESIVGIVLRTGRAARMHNYENASGPGAALGRELGLRSSVGAPIVVDQRLWGVMIVSSKDDRPLPADTESRTAAFTELVATAISNTEARTEVGRLAEEQAALRRVATLVARETAPDAVFAAVAREVGEALGVDATHVGRYDGGGAVVSVAQWGRYPTVPIGARFPLEGDSVSARVLRTGRPARMDNYEDAPGVIAATIRQAGIRFSIGVPILVEGRTWGVMTATSKGAEPFPAETASRLQLFTGLVATAISNATAHEKVRVLADGQAALRRVATLVAHESPPGQVFAAVAEEVGRLLRVEDTTIFRYEDDWTAIVVADRGERDVPMPIGSRVSLKGESATALVRRTGRAARVDDFSGATGPLADYTRDAGIGSTVGSPIVVDGRLWGAMIAATRTDEPMPADTELRIEEFTELVATAISNMQARSDLAASRARLVTAGDEARRRVVRDLHDGAQQRLVHTIVTLKLAQRSFRDGDGKAVSLLGEALEQAKRGNEELRELAHGILPAVLTRGGLRAGVDAVVTRVDLPVAVDVPAERFPAEIEASAYFIVAEALTNVVKHSNAQSAEVRTSVEDGMLHVEVRDNGIGGADPDGHGLLGMTDRVTALGGRLKVESPAGGGTLVAATLPLSAS